MSEASIHQLKKVTVARGRNAIKLRTLRGVYAFMSLLINIKKYASVSIIDMSWVFCVDYLLASVRDRL